MDQQLRAMCGAYCGECGWRDRTNCPGCQASQGKMFWGQCAVASCAFQKRYPHCGMCPELPCETLRQAFDHPQHGDNGERLANLNTWADGKDTYVSLTKRSPIDGVEQGPVDNG